MKEKQLISPTGKSIRIMDHFGSGLYNAPRGNVKHNGVDFLCEPGQIIGKKVSRGQRIGIAQDISKLYNTGEKKMRPHIHLQIECIDPMILLS